MSASQPGILLYLTPLQRQQALTLVTCSAQTMQRSSGGCSVSVQILALLLGNCFNDIIALLGSIGFAPLTVFFPVSLHRSLYKHHALSPGHPACILLLEGPRCGVTKCRHVPTTVLQQAIILDQAESQL